MSRIETIDQEVKEAMKARDTVRTGFLRYNLIMMHLLPMAGMVIKMLLRWSINLKYIVFIPEWFFNI